MPKYSVIVPTYNVENYIEKCLNSILNQDFDDYEIVVVNDGSTDKSGEIVARIVEENPDKINMITQENKGLGGARNTGIKAAKGEYFILVDSDDYVTPDMFSKVNAFLTKNPVDLLFFDYERVDEDGNSLEYVQTHSSGSTVFTLEQEPDALFMATCAWNKIYHRSLFEKTGVLFPDRAWFEDLATVLNFYPYAEKIGYINEAFYKYLQRSGSIMNSQKIERNSEIIDAVNSPIEFYKEKGLYEKYAEEFEYLAVLHIYVLASVRVVKLDHKAPVLNTLRNYILENFPNFKNNKYCSEMSKKEKLIIKLVDGKKYFILKQMLNLNDRLKG